MKLFVRDEFRTNIFKRDNHKCVICNKEAKDAHHIIERRLFTDGGYYLDNGVSLCAKHHIEAEMTTLSCEELREKAGIKNIVLPQHFYKDEIYDKWGNNILPNGNRLKGELFFDPSVQKILKLGNILHLFVNYIKYPRTYHLPWSCSITRDDKVMPSTKFFTKQEIIILEKMDGENTTMYTDHIHARSITSGNHVSRNWVKNFHAKFAYEIPYDYRICGENLHYTKSISYNGLTNLFLGFSIWDKNICLSWDETMEWFALLGIDSVPIIYRGMYDEEFIKNLSIKEEICEGYVVRVTDSFLLKDFKLKVGKYVRKNHIITHGNWMRSKLIENNKNN